MICKNCHRAVDWLNVGRGFRVLVHTHSGAARCDFGWGVAGRNAQLAEQETPPHRDRQLLGRLIAKYPVEAQRILREVTKDLSRGPPRPLHGSGGRGEAGTAAQLERGGPAPPAS